ncbi:hypothetical protein [Vibrio jasicida]|uniref:hypothetical protein n=1 Tax=Vibrio jasicida TaxID=766224 RepID=UPI00163FB0F5|nr:hypothetical protein [Vibrio jasicida]
MISYCTERTTEFAVFPAFSLLLSTFGENAPIQYWQTREGNNTSYALHGSEEVYLVAFFARRPKVKLGKEGLFQGKINNYIFEFHEEAKKYGVPVFCGFPVSNNLYEMNNSEKVWFYLSPNAPKYFEVVFEVTSHKKIRLYDSYDHVYSVNDNDVISILEQSCNPMSWSRASEIMTELNRKPSASGPWFTRGWQYKPVYFVVKSKP